MSGKFSGLKTAREKTESAEVVATPAVPVLQMPTGVDEAPPVVSQTSSKPESKAVRQIDSKTARQATSELVSQPDGKPDGKLASELSRQQARQKAADLAATPWKTVGLKLPAGLDDWLTEAAFTRRKQGTTKQELLSRALQLLYVELEDGE